MATAPKSSAEEAHHDVPAQPTPSQTVAQVHVDTPEQAAARQMIDTNVRVTSVASSSEDVKADLSLAAVKSGP